MEKYLIEIGEKEKNMLAELDNFKNALAEKRYKIDMAMVSSMELSDIYNSATEIDTLKLKEAQIESIQSDAKKIKKYESEKEELRKTITGPLDACKALVMAYVKPSEIEATSAVGKIRNVVLDWKREQQRIKEEKERKLREIQEAEQRKIRLAAELKDNELIEKTGRKLDRIDEVIKEENKTKAAPAVDKRMFRENWKARVVDPFLVPEEHKIVDIQGLNALARSSKGTAKVPGVIFYSD